MKTLRQLGKLSQAWSVFEIEKQMEIVWLIWIGWKIKRFSRFINRWLKHIIFFLFISGCPNVFDADWLIRSDREKIDEKLKETKRKRTEIIGHGDVFVKGKSSLWRQLIQFNYTPNATMNATEWFVVRRYVCSVGAVIGDRVSLNIEKKIIVIDRICLRRQPEKKCIMQNSSCGCNITSRSLSHTRWQQTAVIELK